MVQDIIITLNGIDNNVIYIHWWNLVMQVYRTGQTAFLPPCWLFCLTNIISLSAYKSATQGNFKLELLLGKGYVAKVCLLAF